MTTTTTAPPKDEIEELIKKTDTLNLSGRLVPPGCIETLRNLTSRQIITLTDDAEEAKKLGDLPKVEAVPFPMVAPRLSSAAANKSPKKERTFLLFSHLSSSLEEIQKYGMAQMELNSLKHPQFDGILFDARTAEKTDGYDVFLESFESDGNISRIHLMPSGWSKAIEHGQVCYVCGKFDPPASFMCLVCGGGRFCSNACLFKATRSEVHSKEICHATSARIVSTRIMSTLSALQERQQHSAAAPTIESK